MSQNTECGILSVEYNINITLQQEDNDVESKKERYDFVAFLTQHKLKKTYYGNFLRIKDQTR